MSRPGFTAMAKVETPGGGVKLLNEDRYRDLAKRLRPGLYKMTLEAHVENRSADQNKYLHAEPFPKLMEAFGYDSMEELKRDLMGECWGWTVSPITQQHVPVRPHTSEMNVEECTFFIDWLIPWGTQRGVLIDPPKKTETAA